METSFERALAFVLLHEGGDTITNDSADPGGLTKWGISQRSFPSVDIRGLTRESAARLYREHYWDHCKCGQLPYPLAFILFDSAVNQGRGAAVRLLQKSLGVTADGVVGPATIAAARNANLQAAICALVARRAFAYAQTDNLQRFGLGWFSRLATCHQAAMVP